MDLAFCRGFYDMIFIFTQFSTKSHVMTRLLFFFLITVECLSFYCIAHVIHNEVWILKDQYKVDRDFKSCDIFKDSLSFSIKFYRTKCRIVKTLRDL